MGPPTDLLNAFLSDFEIDRFIETGTYKGHTAKWAAERIPEVCTIEKSDKYFKESMMILGEYTNIQLFNGESANYLRELSLRDGRSIFWLDAHWSGGMTSGREAECPILSELDAIGEESKRHIILIDDARLFLAPPPAPHNQDQWPSIREVLIKLHDYQEGYSVIYDDVIIGVPLEMKRWLQEFLRVNS